MADINLAKMAERAQDAPEPIKRTVQRTAKANPLQPVLADSWENRSKRDGADTEVGSTKQIRTYTPAETLAVLRALRRASDALNVGVRIDAPHVMVPGKGDKEKPEYRAGNVRFEAVTRQKRARKENGEQASTEAPEQAGDEDSEDANPEQASAQPEPAWS